MDRITQLQDEIQQLLTIMSSSIAYLTSRSNFLQVTSEIPVTKQRNREKYDEEGVFEENKKELVTDLVRKAKQVEYLINSLPEPESEEEQAQRFQQLEQEMQLANVEYAKAVARLKSLHAQISDLLRSMLAEVDASLIVDEDTRNEKDKRGKKKEGRENVGEDATMAISS
jgi:mediator of RNA polymerase II transcription subunit 21